MNKKIVITLSVLFFSVSAALVYVITKDERNVPKIQETPKTAASESSSSQPDEPYAKYQDLPTKPKINLPGSSDVSISDRDNDNMTMNAIQSFIFKPSNKLEWMQVTDSQKDPLYIDSILSSVDAKIPPQIANMIDPSDYRIFSCGFQARAKNLSLVLSVLPFADQDKANRDTISYMRDWESNMFYDIKGFLFDKTDFTQKDLNQSILFADGKYRHAFINLPGKVQSSINYAVKDGYIIISNSPYCLDKTVEKMFPL